MKQLKYLFLVMLFGLGIANAQEECNTNQVRYQQLMKKGQLEQAYPLWKGQLDNCPKFTINIYNHADNILVPLISKASGAKKEQYVDDLMQAYKQRLQYFPEDKNLVKGDYISYQLKYGRLDSLQAEKQLHEVFQKAISDRTKISANTLENYFYNGVYLYYYGKITDPQYLEMFDEVKQAIQVNIDIRNQEKEPLEDKIYGKTDSLGNVIVAKAPLDNREKQIYTNDTANISFLQNVNTEYDGIFNQYLEMNCFNLNRIVEEGYASNVDNKDWLKRYYFMMQDQACDSPTYAKLENRLLELYPESSGQAVNEGTSGGGGNGLSNNAIKGTSLYGKKQYSAAIPYLKKAIDETSNNNNKANYAVMVANCYAQTGSYQAGVSWANKALEYKPGYGTAYQIIAYCYYKGAGQLPGNSYQQRAAGWVAADYARRAGDGKTAAQYDMSAPSSQECFMNGIDKGSTYKVGGWINKSTTARCVNR